MFSESDWKRWLLIIVKKFATERLFFKFVREVITKFNLAIYKS